MLEWSVDFRKMSTPLKNWHSIVVLVREPHDLQIVVVWTPMGYFKPPNFQKSFFSPCLTDIWKLLRSRLHIVKGANRKVKYYKVLVVSRENLVQLVHQDLKVKPRQPVEWSIPDGEENIVLTQQKLLRFILVRKST